MFDHIVTPAADSVNDHYPTTVSAAALWWLGRGWQPVPLRPGKKVPRFEDWQTAQLTPEEVPTKFRSGANLGVRLDSGLVDLDLDRLEALTLAPAFLPETGWISGRQGNPRSHWWYQADGLRAKKFADPTGGKCFLEIRAGKLQTAVPPTVLYVDQVSSRYSWDTWTATGLAGVAGEALTTAANRLAAAALLLRFYPRQASYRHDLALALAGGLVHGGWEESQVSHFIRAIAGAAGDEELDNRLAGVWTSFRRQAREQPAQGWSTVAKLLTEHGQPGRAVVQSVRQWLGLDATRGQANGPAAAGPTVAAGGGWDPGPPEDGPPEDGQPEGNEGDPGGAKPPGGPPKVKVSLRLVQLCLDLGVKMFHTPEEDSYAVVRGGSHTAVLPVTGKRFRLWLANEYRKTFNDIAGSQALIDAVRDLEAHGLFNGPTFPVYNRVATRGGNVYLDLRDSAGHVVEIRPDGWDVMTTDPPVYFRRSPGALPLPIPQRGGSLQELRAFLPNLADHTDWLLVLGWLFHAFHLPGPYGLLYLRGEPGSGKSTAARVLQLLIDPNVGNVRAEPREQRDLVIAANNCWLMAYDNLSRPPDWIPDSLCRLTTGGGSGGRMLFTDDEEKLFNVQRPVLVTAITDVFSAPDLLSRLLPICLLPLEDKDRQAEELFWPAFLEARPRILGALLDGLCAGLRTVPSLPPLNLPRHADLARWAEACCRGLGMPPNTFVAAVQRGQEETTAVALEASPVAAVLLGARSSLDGFTGTASALLTELNTLADEKVQKSKNWPASANFLTNILRRLAPNLRAAGLDVRFHTQHSGRKRLRLISLTYLGPADGPEPNDPPNDPPGAEDPPRRYDPRGETSPTADAASDPGGGASDLRPIPPANHRTQLSPCAATTCYSAPPTASDASDHSRNFGQAEENPPPRVHHQVDKLANESAAGPPAASEDHQVDKLANESASDPPADPPRKSLGNHRTHRTQEGECDPKVLPPKELIASDGSGGGSDADRTHSPRDRTQAWRPTPHGRYLYVDSPEQLSGVSAAVGEASWVALDTETVEQEPLHWRTAKVRLIQLAVLLTDGQLVAFVLDAFRLGQAALATVLTLLSRKDLLVHNSEFDLPRLVQLGMPLPTGAIEDSLINSRLLTAGTTWSNSLDAVVKRHLGIDLNKDLQTSDWGAEELSDEQLSYAARDVLLLPAVDEKLQLALAAAKLGEVAAIERRCAPAWQWLTVSGLPVDRGEWAALAVRSAADRARLAEDLAAAAPARPGRLGGLEQWNFSSNQQVLEILHRLGFTSVTDSRDETLATLDHPWVKVLRDYRSATWLDGAYGSAFLRFVDPGTGRIYAKWRQMGNEAGRTSCLEPNLQQIPRDKAYRFAFRAPPGRVLIKADYSAVHLRIVAALAPEPRMVEAFRNGVDLHKLTAASLLGKKVEDIPDKGPERQLAKAVNFGLLYGMGAQTLQVTAATDYQVTLTLAEARHYREKFFETYPGIWAWHQRTAAARASQRETRSGAGRRRLLDHKTPLQHRLNSPVLGTEGDGAKTALALLWERRADCPSAFPVAFVHDEIVVECDVRDRETAACWLRRAMEDGLRPLIDPVPVVVEVQGGPTWAG